MAPSHEKFPVAGLSRDGWSTEDDATATCFCGPGLINRHACHCSDCLKISTTFHMSNITVSEPHLRHVRGRTRLKTFAQSQTARSGGRMTNYFYHTYGSLMYCKGELFPGLAILLTGTVDDFSLAETKLRLQVEQFVETRVAWQRPIEGVPQVVGLHTPAGLEGTKP